jgi:hypothetical protein
MKVFKLAPRVARGVHWLKLHGSIGQTWHCLIFKISRGKHTSAQMLGVGSLSALLGKWRNMAIASGEPPWAWPKQKQNGGGTAWPLQAAMFLFFSGGLAFGCKWNWKNPHEHLAWDHATCTHTILRKIENSESLSIESLSSYPFYFRITFSHIFRCATAISLGLTKGPGTRELKVSAWGFTHPQYAEICRDMPLLYFNSLPCQTAQYGTI